MMENNKKILFLIDAYALIYRSYYALIRAPRINSKGLNTSAVMGFTNTLHEVMRKVQPTIGQLPTHIAVAFDHGLTFRHELFPEYKAQREETPEDIRLSIPIIKELLQALHIPTLQVDGFEADDVIGTVAGMAEREGLQVYMLTPDKDYAQLVTEKIHMYRPRHGGGYEDMGPKEVCEKYGIDNTDQVIDLLGLMGDSSDNYQGCPGVGEKTAVKLIQEFGSIEGLLSRSSEVKGKLREKVEQSADQIKLSKTLATIRTDVPVNVTMDEMRITEGEEKKVREIFEELEFKTLANKFFGTEGDATASESDKRGGKGKMQKSVSEKQKSVNTQLNFFEEFQANDTVDEKYRKENGGILPSKNIKQVDNQEVWEEFRAKILSTKKFILDEKTTSNDIFGSKIEKISITTDGEEVFVLEDDFMTQFLQDESCYKEKIIVVHDAKKLLKSLFGKEGGAKTLSSPTREEEGLKEEGLNEEGLKERKEGGAKTLSSPTREEEGLKEEGLDEEGLDEEGLNGRKEKREENTADEGRVRIYEFMESCKLWDVMVAHYLINPDLHHSKTWTEEEWTAERAVRLYKQSEELEKRLREDGLEQLFLEVEMPLTAVLAEMEINGIRLDTKELQKVQRELEERLVTLEKDIYALAGEPFNIASPRQVGDILFGKMQIMDKPKKTKTGQYVTNEETLNALRADNPIVGKILDHRALKKLLGTYVEALPRLINSHTAHLHTTFNQCVTATGRLSSSDPNLQNIPVRTEDGKEIRRCFLPEEGEDFLSADYSQVELRIMASLSGDKHMIEAFRTGQDIHAATSAKINHKAIDEVTREERSKAKSANFGIIYGISAFGLAQGLGIDRKEAKQLIDNYFKEFPNVADYIERCKEDARTAGYAITIMGRRRYLPDINSRNGTVRAFAERNAVNAPIQGTAADIMKVAMVNVWRRLHREGMHAHLLLQVHDELNLSVSPQEHSQVEQIVREEMEHAAELSVPLTVECGWGKNWLEAH
ncbi:MAG: DNA polymerase I [Prevotella sp.]|nr:DNA polymerase I [Prevotella sp.]